MEQSEEQKRNIRALTYLLSRLHATVGYPTQSLNKPAELRIFNAMATLFLRNRSETLVAVTAGDLKQDSVHLVVAEDSEYPDSSGSSPGRQKEMHIESFGIQAEPECSESIRTYSPTLSSHIQDVLCTAQRVARHPKGSQGDSERVSNLQNLLVERSFSRISERFSAQKWVIDAPYSQVLQDIVFDSSTVVSVHPNLKEPKYQPIRKTDSPSEPKYLYEIDYRLHPCSVFLYQEPVRLGLAQANQRRRDAIIMARARSGLRDEMEDGAAADLRLEPGEKVPHQFLRWVRRLVAWMEALDVVVGHPLLQSRTGVTVGVTIVHPPTSPTDMIPISPIVEAAPFPRAASAENRRTMIEFMRTLVGDEAWLYGKGFQGSYHCTASFLAFQYISQTTDLHMPSHEHADLEALTPRFSRSLGLPRKVCYCCSLLSILMNGEDFKKIGCRSRILPWSPPPHGIPDQILGKIEKDLQEELADALKKQYYRIRGPKLEVEGTVIVWPDGTKGITLYPECFGFRKDGTPL